jgi:hypothetical protein
MEERLHHKIQTHNPKFATNFVSHGRKITPYKPTIQNLLLNFVAHGRKIAPYKPLIQNLLQILWHMDERLHHTNSQSKICF